MKKECIIGIILMLFSINLINAAIYNSTEGTKIYECGNITGANLTYNLNQSINTTITCIRIQANNITLNISGFNITGDDGKYDYGIYNLGYNNSVVKNGYIYDFGIGILITNGYNGNFTNMTIYANADFGIMSTIYGIYLDGGQNNSIINNNVTMNNTGIDMSKGYGIYLATSSNNTIQDNTANSNTDCGIFLDTSSNNTIQNNTANSNIYYGIYLGTSSNNTIQNNTANSNTNYGIYLGTSSNNIMTNNNMSNNTYNFRIYGAKNEYFDNNIDASNIVDYSYKIYYNYSISNYVFDLTSVPDAGFVICAKCDNITTKDLNLSHYNYHGIYFFNTSNSRIENITASLNDYGVYLYASSNNIVTNNTANSNIYYGIYLTKSSNNNIITNNTANSNANWGLASYDSSNNNTFRENTANSNNYGIYLGASSNNTIQNNIVNSNGETGIWMYSYSHKNQLINNTINSNHNSGINLNTNNNQLINNTINSNYGYGIYIRDSSSNNNITENTINSNNIGIRFDSSTSNNNIRGNTANSNHHEFSFTPASSHSFNQNKLNNNLHTRIINTSLVYDFAERGYNKNQEISFSPIITYINGTNLSVFDYNVRIYPNQTLTLSNTSNILNINFTPTTEGLHSVIINVTTSLNNTEIRKFIFLVGNASSDSVRYYFHEDEPTHGQPRAEFEADAGSMFSYPVTSEEWRACTGWVQFSPDEIIKPLYIIKNVSISWLYKVSSATPSVGYQRYATYGTNVDHSVQVPSAADYVWNQTNLTNVNFTLDYIWSIYWTSIKLVGTNSYVMANSSHPSYADFTYLYAEPKIEQFTAESGSDIRNARLLSATYNSDEKDNVTLQLEGEGNFTIALNLTSSSYTVKYDGTNCSSNENCTVNTNSNGIINVTLALGSLHTLEIYNDTTSSADQVSSGGGGIPPFWRKTYVLTNEQFKKGYSKELEERHRFKINISGEWHYAGIVKLNNSSAVINVSSIPQQELLSIGDENKFEVTDDNYYDIYVKLNSIADNKANLTIKSIYEEVPSAETTGKTIETKEALPAEDSKTRYYLLIKFFLLIVIILAILFILLKNEIFSKFKGLKRKFR